MLFSQPRYRGRMKKQKATPTPVTADQHRHAQKITHRAGDGTFKAPPPKGPRIGKKKLKPGELDQDAGNAYNPDGTEPQP